MIAVIYHLDHHILCAQSQPALHCISSSFTKKVVLESQYKLEAIHV